MVGVLTTNRTLTEWRTVFYISCAFLVITNIIYVVFSSGETQSWNDPDSEKPLEDGSAEEKEDEKQIEKSEKAKEDDRL